MLLHARVQLPAALPTLSEAAGVAEAVSFAHWHHVASTSPDGASDVLGVTLDASAIASISESHSHSSS